MLRGLGAITTKKMQRASKVDVLRSIQEMKNKTRNVQRERERETQKCRLGKTDTYTWDVRRKKGTELSREPKRNSE